MADLYHIGFGPEDLGENPPTLAILSGDPGRATQITQTKLSQSKTLSYPFLLYPSFMAVVSGSTPSSAAGLERRHQHQRVSERTGTGLAVLGLAFLLAAGFRQYGLPWPLLVGGRFQMPMLWPHLPA